MTRGNLGTLADGTVCTLMQEREIVWGMFHNGPCPMVLLEHPENLPLGLVPSMRDGLRTRRAVASCLSWTELPLALEADRWVIIPDWWRREVLDALPRP